MNPINRNILLMVFMFAASCLAIALHPTRTIAKNSIKGNLEKIIPSNFSKWHAVESPHVLVQLSEESREKLSGIIYDQTVMRTYVDTAGNSIMVAIAYGARQSYGLNMHLPERCYSAQGFETEPSQYLSLTVQGHNIPVTKLVAKQGQRIEPITYWVRIGQRVVRSSLGIRAELLWAGLGGFIPDGILVRISNIITSEQSIQSSYELQQSFLIDFIDALSEEGKQDLLGDMLLQ